MKWCANCQQKLRSAKFAANRSTRDGLQSYCKACMAAIVREHRVRTGKVVPGRKVGRPRKAAA
jgi:NAD-dependent SIR2 family protein deacetylase